MNALAEVARRPIDEQREALAAITAQLDAHYRDNIWDWLIEQVWTQNEAKREMGRWPDKEYLREVFAWIEQEPLLGFPKSRRMMASWAVCAWATHRARYFPFNAIFIMSEVEEKAAFMVEKRCKFIEDNLDNPLLRRSYNGLKTSRGVVGKMTWDGTGSYIWGLAQGADVLRAYTGSAVILDESDFQAEGQKAYAAALPMIEQGAKLIAISTSNGPMGLLAEICLEAGYRRHTG